LTRVFVFRSAGCGRKEHDMNRGQRMEDRRQRSEVTA
jgi:hypothetical protein